jgi:hypothetical protein
MHSLAIAIAFFLLVVIFATMLETPVEILSALGVKWCHKVMLYFEGEY